MLTLFTDGVTDHKPILYSIVAFQVEQSHTFIESPFHRTVCLALYSSIW